ncbi:MAG TPA: hypothetical protein VF172_03200 [Nitrososphaera sp.]|jgi:hypothetical protein
MEQLESMMLHSSVDEEDEPNRPGRRTELKTYLIESNADIPSTIQTDRLTVNLQDTGIENIKLLHLGHKGKFSSFYLDRSDKRFWLLHTHGLAEDVDAMVDTLISIHSFRLDSAWLSTGMLKGISDLSGNKFDGAGIDYQPLFYSEEEPEVAMEELKISAFGSRAIEALRNMADDEAVKNYFAYKKVRIVRGSKEGYAKDDLHFSGRFSVKSGKSIDDHMALVDSAKALYRDKMNLIEGESIGVKKEHDHYSVLGKPFEFILDKPIVNWDAFLDVFLSSTDPFRLWGIKKEVGKGYLQILAVDLHTGHPLDIEMTTDMLRAYLPQGSCGNTILRLFVNLQQYIDSKIKCENIPLDGV